jgi:uncharacterized protein
MDRIDVFTVARNRADWSGRLPLAAMPRLCASLMDGPGDRDGMLAYRCRGLIDAQGRPGLELWLEAVLPLRCDRCAQKLALVLEAERAFYFVTTQAELAAIPIDDTPEEALLGSAQFDLAALIEDEAILQLPISPRHADCVGVARAAPAQPSATADPSAAPGPPHPFAGLAALREQLQGPAAPDGAGGAETSGAGPRKARPKTS